MRNKSFFILILATLLGAVFYFYEKQVFSPHFVDEEDSFVLGKYISQGEVLYRDLFSHHQPLSYVFSASLQETLHPNSIYLLIKRHREFIMLWAAIWWLILGLRMGWSVLLIALVYETTKVYLLGHLFLSESLAVYPLMFLSSLVLFKPKQFWEYFVFGLSCGLIIFLLSPLWPAVVLLCGILFWRNIDLKKIAFFILGFGIIIGAILPFVSLTDYIFNAFYINFAYYIPSTSRDGWPTNITRGVFSIITPIFSQINDSQILIIIKTLAVLLLVNLFLFLKQRKYKLTFLIIILLGLANIRYVQPGLQYYSGFHILPWFGLLVFFSLYSVVKLPKRLMVCIVAILILEIMTAKNSLFTPIDRETAFYVNYSRQSNFGAAVNIMKSKTDTLFVAPDEWLIFWQGDIGHANKMVNYYAWMSDVRELRSIVENTFKNNPPAFFYCDCTGHYFGLEKYWDLYQPIIQDNKATKLLVLKSKISSLSKDQKGLLKYYLFNID